MKKARVFISLVGLILLCGCAKTPQPSDKAEDIEERTESSFPSKYSLADENRITEMASQEATAMCWAYTIMNVAESNLLTQGVAQQEDLNLSEAHLVYYTYSRQEEVQAAEGEDLQYMVMDSRGRDSMGFYIGGGDKAIYMLANGMGPVLEKEVPFNNESEAKVEQSVDNLKARDEAGEIKKYMGDYLLKEADYYSDADRDRIKECIMNNGAMMMSFHMDLNYYTEAKAYHCPKAGMVANHMVSLIGWDDQYSKENFGENQPLKDGAWLVLDSAAKAYGGDGYLWISYETKVPDRMASLTMCERDEYGEILFYDSLGPKDFLIAKGKDTTIANVYYVEEDREIKAVGIYTVDDEQPVEICVYTDVPEGKPDGGICRAKLSVQPQWAGYHVVDLEETIPIGHGVAFSVVVKYQGGDSVGKAPVEGADTSYYRVLMLKDCYTSQKGQSYAFNEGVWYDLADEDSAKVFDKSEKINNACIRVLLKNYNAEE